MFANDFVAINEVPFVLNPTSPNDSLETDSPSTPYKISKDGNGKGLDLPNPSNVRTEVTYNPITGKYEERTKIGERFLPGVKELSRDEYLQKVAEKQNRDYFEAQGKAQNFARGSRGTGLKLGQPEILDKIMGNGFIDIQPTGTAEIKLGFTVNRVRNPAFAIRQQKPPPQFVFDQNLQVGVNGNIGDRIKLGMRYDTKATFDFENQTKLNWAGKEDDIIKKVEIGNISMPLNSSLIQGGSSLFGFKTEMQFGRLNWTALFSQNKGQRQEKTVAGGAQITQFNVQGDQYDVNRHFFLGQFLYDNYDRSLENIPIISPAITINRVEVWVTNRNAAFENTRDIVAFMDLGESVPFNPNLNPILNSPLPANNSNDLFQRLVSFPENRNSSTVINSLNANLSDLEQGLDYEFINYARKLNPNEYTLNPRLGYVSLNQALNNDEVLAVAFEYTSNIDGQVYQVGEFAQDIPDATDNKVLFLKMLKGTIVRTKIPLWKLMMKNIYSLNTFNLNLEDFKLDVVYADDPSGADLNYLPVENVPGLSGGVPLIRVLNLDRINRQSEAKPDGIFDAIEGITVNTQKGQIIFPVAEPFGKHLRRQFGNDTLTADRYVFNSLYDSTKWLATQDVFKNKFFIKGSYKGTSSAEIMLNSINVPPGSVQVFANGSKLKENQDYVVDYNAGKVTIVNQGILSSGANITVSSENNTMFSTQQKTMMGSRFDYKFNEKLNLGGTFMHMYERPLTPKTNIGDDPLMNTIFGFDGAYSTKSRFLTKMVDKLPFIETKEESSFLIQGEYAQIIPGRARSIQRGERGVSYIDDFEAAETPFDLRLPNNWKLASLPQKQPDLFPEWNNSLEDKTPWLDYRSLLNWYTIDPTFFRNDQFTPEHISSDVDMQSNHYMREVSVVEVFQNKQLQQGVPNILPTLDLAYFPKEKGPYNYNSKNTDLNADGKFLNPDRTWGGIMRRIETNDFEATNIDYIEIWMMDPYHYHTAGSEPTGQLYLNLGNISEDILPDRRKSFENGLPKDANGLNKDESTFGNVPILPQINNAFDNAPASRPFQDIGLDGLSDEEERNFYKQKYLDELEANFGINSPIYQQAFQDPSNDNYLHNRDQIYNTQEANIINRYKKFNGHQGNSTLEQLEDGSGPKSATTLPDVEDINGDFTMNQTEDYFQYKIEFSKNSLEIGQNYVTDIVPYSVKLRNGTTDKINWIQFKIPIREYEKAVGNISDFKSIRFMRMFMKGFDDSIVLRIGQLQLVRSDWRRYLPSLKKPGVVVPVDPNDNTVFSISTVNIEENATRRPVPYVTPPGIPREIDPITPGAVQRNEQSIALNVCNLAPEDARGAFKAMNLDIRNYKNFKMFVHAEGENIQYGELTAFVRIGTDLVSNYYEYEVPLTITQPFINDPAAIWPSANEMNFELEEFYLTKQERSNAGAAMGRPFTRVGPNNSIITLIGLPDLSNVRVIMLGVRNKSNRPQCAEVWFNEMRVTDISNKGGWAANGRMVAQLADLSTVNVTGSIRTIGFGGLEQRLNQRSLTNQYQYDVNSNIELGKFFPAKSGITIPMFINYNENIIQPKYNPLNPDIELSTTLRALQNPEEAERVRRAAEDYTSKYSLNFVNVRKNRSGSKKAMPWDIENFNTSYSYQSIYRRNQQIEEQIQKTYRGSLGYNYSNTPKPWEPLKKVIKSKNLDIIRDFNLYLLPQNISARYDVDRYYSEMLNRSNDLFRAQTPRLFDKNFTMTRFYNVGWNLTKSLKFDYQSNANARIEEPVGRLDSEVKRDSVRREFMSLGQMTRFDQTANINYTVPFSKIKSLNWIQMNARYSANFNWNQPPPAAPTLGGTIQNSQNLDINTTLTLITLYNKSKTLRELNSPARGSQRKPAPSPKAPTKPGEKEKDKEKEEKKKELSPGAKNVLRFVTMFKQVNVTYNENNGTTLPGFVHTPQYFGNNFNANAPGLDFIMGSQNPEIRYRLAEQAGLTNDRSQAQYYIETLSRRMTGKISLEPIKDMKIDLDFNLTQSNRVQSLFRFDDSTGGFRDFGLQETGQFTTSAIFIQTAFSRDNEDYSSPVFDQFKNNRFVVAQRLQNQDNRVENGLIDTTRNNFPLGYSENNQDVLIPAFIAAYTNRNNQSVSLSPFRNIPLPSWRVNYNGLGKIKSLKEYFTNITLLHNYSGTYTVSGFTTNLQYSPTASVQIGQDFIPQYQIQTITIVENFAPVAGVNVTLKNNWNFKFEYRKTRQISLMVTTHNVTENKRDEYSFAAGYRAKDVVLPIRWRGSRIVLENDLNFMMEVSYADNILIVRNINTPLKEPNSGSSTLSIRPTLDYMVNSRINLSLYLDHRSNNPKTSNAFPTALTDFGFRLRYTL